MRSFERWVGEVGSRVSSGVVGTRAVRDDQCSGPRDRGTEPGDWLATAADRRFFFVSGLKTDYNAFCFSNVRSFSLHGGSSLGPLRNMTTATAASALITAEKKKPQDAMSDYLRYFERVMDANDWDDAAAAKIFPALLEVGSTALNDLDDKTLGSFKAIKMAILPSEECYREAKVMRFFQCRQKDSEQVETYLKRVNELVSECYPKFAKANRELLVRDRFVHSLLPDLRRATLHQSSSKLNEAVQSALMAETMRTTLKENHRNIGNPRQTSNKRTRIGTSKAGGGARAFRKMLPLPRRRSLCPPMHEIWRLDA